MSETSDLPGQFNDRAYKKFLEHPSVVADFLRSFVDPAWVEKLDVARAERENTSFITPQYRKYENDVVIKIPLKDSQEVAYLYILIELQSVSEKYQQFQIRNLGKIEILGNGTLFSYKNSLIRFVDQNQVMM